MTSAQTSAARKLRIGASFYSADLLLPARSVARPPAGSCAISRRDARVRPGRDRRARENPALRGLEDVAGAEQARRVEQDDQAVADLRVPLPTQREHDELTAAGGRVRAGHAVTLKRPMSCSRTWAVDESSC